ncbi:alpha/beta hydrolase [Streptomyces sp. ALI-76-A]|uniref:alpha/beta fold hydrolase n=1 Tax=Streptomyces sp. ALI-76-A TaxID=3025736 RepID=UPI00256EFCA4|nr:alpha/beta hydrolase [Streptomyces sp. ALI-76-A]MDL5199802.1 alpha/beta hydrolase [Streptomyces sp. ALI-76-A]
MIEHVNGVDLAFDEWGINGSTPPLLLLHGFLSSRSDWASTADELSAIQHVIAFDHRGHGQSTHIGSQSAYTIGHLVADVEGFVAARGFDTVDLLGHSLGGIVAMHYALARPERVRSMVLLNTTAEPTDPTPPHVIGRLAELGRSRGMPGLGRLLEQIGDPSRAVRDEEQRARYRFDVGRCDVEAFAALGVEIGTHASMLQDLGSLRIPVTVMVGENDTPVREGCAAVAASIPRSRLVVIPGAAHLPHLQSRDQWLKSMSEHQLWVAE